MLKAAIRMNNTIEIAGLEEAVSLYDQEMMGRISGGKYTLIIFHDFSALYVVLDNIKRTEFTAYTNITDYVQEVAGDNFSFDEKMFVAYVLRTIKERADEAQEREAGQATSPN